MQIYLFAVNLFALAALLVGLSGLSSPARYGRLLPLFLLATSRSLILILFLAASGPPPPMIAALEVFSAFCLVWALSGYPARMPAPWPELARLGAVMALFLALAPVFPQWPVPFQLHSLAIAVFGASFVLKGAPAGRGGAVPWLQLAAPILLALAGLLGLLQLSQVSWFVTLLAYTLLIGGLHYESLFAVRQQLQTYQNSQGSVEAAMRETLDRSRERERLLGLYELLGSAPGLSQAMDHIMKSVAQTLHADQAALLALNGRGQARLVSVYSPARPIHLSAGDETVFELAGCPLLAEAAADPRQVLLPHPYHKDLPKLYTLWGEKRPGPTLIQPLVLQERTVGVLILGNPVTQRQLAEEDAALCRALAPQVAVMVEYRRRYLELERQAEKMAVTLQSFEKPVVKRQAEPLGQAESYLSILETISDGVVVSDVTGRVCLVNPAAEQILGKTRRDLIGQPIGRIYGVIDSRETIEELLVAFSRRNQPLPTFIEDENRAIQGRLLPWRNEASEWLGIVAVLSDVTRTVKAERARNGFIAALSRELRAPLTAVKGYSELILQGVLGEYTPEQLRIQRIIQTGADRMAAILDNAIQLSALNRSRLLPHFDEVNVTRIIDEALREAAPLAAGQQVELSREVKEPLPSITADARQIRRILDNLLVNACQFTLPGGHVTVRAWVQPERAGLANHPHLFLTVADSGVGIPPIEHKRIFDPFYQVKGQNVQEQHGLGLGLAVVKELVELHKGRVRVESVIDGGSIFQVTLPLTQE